MKPTWSSWPLSCVVEGVKGETEPWEGVLTTFRVDDEGLLHVSTTTFDHINEVDQTFRLVPVEKKWVNIYDDQA